GPPRRAGGGGVGAAGHPARRAVGRPRLPLGRARAGAARARDRTEDQPAAPPRRADPGRHTDARGLARQTPPPQNPRPARPPPLADRTHQRLDQSETPRRNPPRPQTRQLPRLHPARDDPRPPTLVLRSLPDPSRTRCDESVTNNARTWRFGRRPRGRPGIRSAN